MAARQPIDALAMLTAEHQNIRKLFQRYAAASHPLAKAQLAEQVFLALDLHAQLEEQAFYPVFAAAADEAGKRLVAKALDAHALCKDLLEDLQDLRVQDPTFEPKFRQLRDTVLLHVQEEELEMFHAAEEVLAEHMGELTDAMQALKKQLLSA